jgi:hypothetical protein
MNDSTLTVPTQEKWEAWLERNGSASSGVWLRLAKKIAQFVEMLSNGEKLYR